MDGKKRVDKMRENLLMKFLVKRIFCVFSTALILLSACTSVPHVSEVIKVEEETVEDEKYQIKISSDYAQKPEEFKYAINSFVKEQGHTSYDIITENWGKDSDYYVIMPGSIPVEDLPPVKHFHKSKTIMATVIPIGGAVVATGVGFVVYFVFDFMVGIFKAMVGVGG